MLAVGSMLIWDFQTESLWVASLCLRLILEWALGFKRECSRNKIFRIVHFKKQEGESAKLGEGCFYNWHIIISAILYWFKAVTSHPQSREWRDGLMNPTS